jgi:hypothetical protein
MKMWAEYASTQQVVKISETLNERQARQEKVALEKKLAKMFIEHIDEKIGTTADREERKEFVAQKEWWERVGRKAEETLHSLAK